MLVVSLAFLVWTVAGRRLSDGPRRATMVATILLGIQTRESLEPGSSGRWVEERVKNAVEGKALEIPRIPRRELAHTVIQEREG